VNCWVALSGEWARERRVCAMWDFGAGEAILGFWILDGLSGLFFLDVDGRLELGEWSWGMLWLEKNYLMSHDKIGRLRSIDLWYNHFIYIIWTWSKSYILFFYILIILGCYTVSSQHGLRLSLGSLMFPAYIDHL
jgi:hypothetical protein